MTIKIPCPHCEMPLTEQQIRSLNGKLNNAIRFPRKVSRAGRPASKDRCPCGIMTRRRAESRGHHCGPL